MDDEKAALILSALANPIRLRFAREIVKAGSAGLAAGKIGEGSDRSPGTVSEHLSKLVGAEVVRVKKKGRGRTYYLNDENISALMIFLRENLTSYSKNQPSLLRRNRPISPLPPFKRKRINQRKGD